MFDQLTKTLLFNHGSIFDSQKLGDGTYVTVPVTGENVLAESIYPDDPEKWLDYKIIGIRSIWRGGVTFLRTRNQFFIQGLSVFFLIVLSFSPLMVYKRPKFVGFIIGVILAGTSGNMIDRFMFLGHVKDILYVPFWSQNGTFNVADAEIISGIILFILHTITSSSNRKNRKYSTFNCIKNFKNILFLWMFLIYFFIKK
ncbi:signal peptidase II [Mycoplasmopsis cynos]|uniref:signal peptidase II n=1 Tax=Mycoplasmopsis cynos TaxID=171284 RepID=UPI0024C9F314|nr:signal peptidase II [Mycoplasmopsis cynos]